MLNINKYRIFLQSVDCGSFSKVAEETGYTPGKLTDIGSLATSPALLTEIIYCYLAEDMTPGETCPDEDEFLEIVKIPFDKVVDMILSGEITDGKTQTAVLKAKLILGL